MNPIKRIVNIVKDNLMEPVSTKYLQDKSGNITMDNAKTSWLTHNNNGKTQRVFMVGFDTVGDPDTVVH